MDRNNVVSRLQTRNLMVRNISKERINKKVSFHLCVVSRLCKDRILDEYIVDNIDETHVIVNHDNGKTLVFVGSEEIKYSDVASGVM